MEPDSDLVKVWKQCKELVYVDPGPLTAEDVPVDNESWNICYKKTLFQTMNCGFTHEQHFDAWKQLTNTAHLTDAPPENFIKASIDAIQSQPLMKSDAVVSVMEPDVTGIISEWAFGYDKRWSYFFQCVYNKIVKKELTELAATPALNAAKFKFGYSLSWSSVYWKVTRKWRKKILKEKCTTYEDYLKGVVEMYKEQFSKPYYNLEEDYEHFKSWASAVKLSKQTMREIQTGVMLRGQEVEEICKIFPQFEEDEPMLHLKFHKYIQQLLKKAIDEDDYLFIFSLCVENIEKYNDCFCYYHMCVHALSCMNQSNWLKSQILLIAKQGLQMGRFGCEGMVTRFLEHTFMVASKYLDKDQFWDLVKYATKAYPLQNLDNKVSVNLWFFVRRGILTGVSNFIFHKKAATDMLYTTYEYLMHPLDPKLVFESNEVPLDQPMSIDLQMRVFDLLKFYVKCEQRVKTLNFDQTVLILRKYVGEKSVSPIYIYGLLHFLRGNDYCPAEVKAAFIRAIDSLKSRTSRSFFDRKCYLQTVYEYLEHLLVFGTVEEQLDVSKRLGFKQSEFNLEYDEVYDLKSNLFLVINERDMSVVHAASQTTAIEENVNNAEKANNTERSSQSSSSMDVDESPMYRLFIHNLNYATTEQEVMDWFAVKNIFLSKVNLKMKSNGKSEGIGILFAASMEDKKKILEEYNRLMIGGRTCVIDDYKEFKKRESGKEIQKTTQLPTVLYISDVPQEMYEYSKIHQELGQFGHIKNINLENDDKNSAKVEYYMPEDCENTHQMWLGGGRIFPQSNVVMRKSFAAKRKMNAGNDNDKKDKLRVKPSTSRFSPPMERREVRKQDPNMRAKLMLPRSIKILNLSPREPLPVKSNEEGPEEGTSSSNKAKTNEDFRQMLLGKK